MRFIASIYIWTKDNQANLWQANKFELKISNRCNTLKQESKTKYNKHEQYINGVDKLC